MRTDFTAELTRRELLSRVGAAGGYGAAYLVMQSLGMLGMLAPVQAIRARPPCRAMQAKTFR